MLRGCVLPVLLALASGFVHAGQSAPGSSPALDVTYVANEGFLVEAGGRKIAIDAFFAGETIDWCQAPSPEMVKLMRSASGPFAAVDLILVTHAHVDHVTPDLLLAHLAANSRAVVAAPPQAVSSMRADGAWSPAYEDRVRAIDLPLFGSKELNFDGIRVEAHRIRHGYYPIRDEATGKEKNKHESVENLAYLVEAGGASFMHFGDAFPKENGDYFDGTRFTKRRIDAAFVEGWSDESLEMLAKQLDPGTIVFMHMPADAGRIEKTRAYVSSKIPNAVVFGRMMERLSLPARVPEPAARLSGVSPRR